AGKFVPLGDVGVGDLLAVGLGDAPITHPGAVTRAHLAKRDVPFLGGRRQPDGDRHQAERDRPLPYRLWHRAPLSSCRTRIVSPPCDTVAGKTHRRPHHLESRPIAEGGHDVMYSLFSWCSDCRADTEFELVTDTMVAEERSAEYACPECGAALVV